MASSGGQASESTGKIFRLRESVLGMETMHGQRAAVMIPSAKWFVCRAVRAPMIVRSLMCSKESAISYCSRRISKRADMK